MDWLRNRSLRVGLATTLGLAIARLPLLTVAQQYVPPRRGIPGRREGAGTRFPGCVTGQKPLMPLMPVDNFSATTAKTPTFFWFVPETQAVVAEFRLLDFADQELYTTTAAIPRQAGVISVQVPATIAAQMQPDRIYRWQFSLRCNLSEPSENPFVEGVVQRVERSPALQNALNTAVTPRDVAAVYANAGIWQDAIATLAEQRCLNPKDINLQTSWTTLLRSVQLEKFADAPLMKNCSAIGSNP